MDIVIYLLIGKILVLPILLSNITWEKEENELEN